MAQNRPMPVTVPCVVCGFERPYGRQPPAKPKPRARGFRLLRLPDAPPRDDDRCPVCGAL